MNRPFNFYTMSTQLLNSILAGEIALTKMETLISAEVIGAAASLYEIDTRIESSADSDENEWMDLYMKAVRIHNAAALPGLPAKIEKYFDTEFYPIRNLEDFADLPVNHDDHLLYALTLHSYHAQAERSLQEQATGLALLLIAAHYIEHFTAEQATAERLRRSMIKVMRTDGELNYERGYAKRLYQDLKRIALSFIPLAETGHAF